MSMQSDRRGGVCPGGGTCTTIHHTYSVSDSFATNCSVKPHSAHTGNVFATFSRSRAS